jgi:hypothetical protein
LALAATVALSACGGSGPTRGASASGLDEARSFRDYTLYYLGDSFHGLPLTSAGRGPGSGTHLRRAWSFVYGSCTPSGDEGCAPPLEVQNWSICTRFPALYPGPTPKTSPLHGAETLPAGGGLDVYTGHTTVVIFGGDKPAVVRSLTKVSDGEIPDALPPPAPGSLASRLPCQAQALDRLSG